MRGLLAGHTAGGAKWMLNDMPHGFNMRERTVGAFGLDGSPKPVVGALAAVRAYLDASGSAPGDLRLEDDAAAGLRYVYSAADARLLGGKSVQGGGVALEAGGPAQLFVTWTEPNSVRVWASAVLEATLDLGQIPGSNVSQDVSLSNVDGATPRPVAICIRTASTLKPTRYAGTFVMQL